MLWIGMLREAKRFSFSAIRHKLLPKLQICDFRRARGVYLLFNRIRTDLRRASSGITDGFGYRLRAHHRDGFKDWTRFCWFSFDGVATSPGLPGGVMLLAMRTLEPSGQNRPSTTSKPS